MRCKFTTTPKQVIRKTELFTSCPTCACYSRCGQCMHLCSYAILCVSWPSNAKQKPMSAVAGHMELGVWRFASNSSVQHISSCRQSLLWCERLTSGIWLPTARQKAGAGTPSTSAHFGNRKEQSKGTCELAALVRGKRAKETKRNDRSGIGTTRPPTSCLEPHALWALGGSFLAAGLERGARCPTRVSDRSPRVPFCRWQVEQLKMKQKMHQTSV